MKRRGFLKIPAAAAAARCPLAGAYAEQAGFGHKHSDKPALRSISSVVHRTRRD